MNVTKMTLLTANTYAYAMGQLERERVNPMVKGLPELDAERLVRGMVFRAEEDAIVHALDAMAVWDGDLCRLFDTLEPEISVQFNEGLITKLEAVRRFLWKATSAPAEAAK